MSPNCVSCGAFVTQSYVRVFGVDGEVDGCLECMTHRDVSAGDAVPKTDGER